jgi:uncharacterized protein with GYD domain
MAKYLFKARYSQQGIAGLLKEGAASRAKAINDLAKSVGGKVESAYWAFGDDDVLIIADMPSNAAAAALASRVSATGAAAVTTTVLLTAAEVDEARGLNVKYRAPGA